MNKNELYKSVELNELIRAYKAILRIKVAFIKYNFIPENVEDHIPPMNENSYEILCKMVVDMDDLLCDIYDICEESSVDDKGI